MEKALLYHLTEANTWVGGGILKMNGPGTFTAPDDGTCVGQFRDCEFVGR